MKSNIIIIVLFSWASLIHAQIQQTSYVQSQGAAIETNNGTYISTIVVGEPISGQVTTGEFQGSTFGFLSTGNSNTLPVADAGMDTDADSGESVTLDGSGTQGGNYTWTVVSGDPTSIDNGANSEDVLVSPIVTTKYLLTVTQNGCTRSDEVVVSINVNKNPIADAGADIVVCKDEDIVIGGDPTGTPPVDDPTSELGYIWSGTSINNLNDNTIPNPTFIN